MGRYVDQEVEESEVAASTLHGRSTQQGAAAPPQLFFLEGLLVPNPHAPLPPSPCLRSQTSPGPGPAGDEETGSSKDSVGGRTGRLETKPEPGWVLASVPVCSLLGRGQTAGAPPGPIPADRCQGAVCSLPGVNFLLKTIKLLKAEGVSTGQRLTLSGMVGTGWLPVWFLRRLSSEAKGYGGYGC